MFSKLAGGDLTISQLLKIAQYFAQFYLGNYSTEHGKGFERQDTLLQTDSNHFKASKAGDF